MVLRRLTFIISLLALVLAVPAVAQDAEFETLAEGLLNPRNLQVMEDGTIYVAEAGIAGPLLSDADEAYGASSRVSMITPDGDVETVVSGLISYREGASLGAAAVHVTDESIWVLLGESFDFSIALATSLIEVNPETGRIVTVVDLLEAELTLDPDGNPNNESNPTDFVVTDDGTVLIANAGCNCVMSWSPDAGVEIAAVWDFEGDNPVPTSLAIGPDGDLYVGFLTGFPFPPEGSRIERWSGGELVETYEGYTAISGLAFDADGNLYATEYGVFDSETFQWGAGRVVAVTEDGPVPVLEGLNVPWGLEAGADGRLYLSINSIGGPDGAVIAFTPDM